MDERLAVSGRDGVAERLAPAPRYEFRTFGSDLSGTFARFRSLGEECGSDERDDVYFIERRRVEAGLKLRGDLLDLKLLTRTNGELELWVAVDAAELPMSGQEISQRFLAPAGMARFVEARCIYDQAALLTAAPRPDLRTGAVRKRRRRYAFDKALGECTELRVSGQGPLQTCAVEGTDASRLAALIGALGLGSAGNVSYPRRLHEAAFGEAV
ncbi:MAG TPA: hypothetical protein PKA33_00030 [Amaricoccus sp.]|uniref:hypothetical protein n=1 Tax=Amaricoccus sp. TaxID=1872485 RepID=UPI002C44AA78|nr:hypothetical protein [Amaricoccus sp.]HMQ92636.1 hypothetical protein [Amaricoccus sp.]HMR52884.1 hypothetical protein [Amaricoccus sp.]HMR59240.1 hypothetical protein [Amaricoccus sp.]HMT97733.1 hypothetical protein [Amaricoccus sp.]